MTAYFESQLEKGDIVKVIEILYLLDYIDDKKYKELISKENYSKFIKILRQIIERELFKIHIVSNLLGDVFGFVQKRPILALTNKITETLNNIYLKILKKSEKLEFGEIPYEIKYLFANLCDFILIYDEYSNLFFLITPNGLKIFDKLFREYKLSEESKIEYALWRALRKLKEKDINLSSALYYLD